MVGNFHLSHALESAQNGPRRAKFLLERVQFIIEYGRLWVVLITPPPAVKACSAADGLQRSIRFGLDGSGVWLTMERSQGKPLADATHRQRQVRWLVRGKTPS